MEWLMHLLVKLRRIRHSKGFGIQSPTDYWLVCYVINEHWPYYQYSSLGTGNDWLTNKLGRLYFRIANWRQPTVIESNAYQTYLKAGCQKASFGPSTELIHLSLEDDCRSQLSYIYNKVKDDTVLIVEGIRHDKELWKEIVSDQRTRITFDLYYCGIVLFDSKRHKHHYIINF